MGIVSERDIVRALATDADADVVWAPDVMTEELVTADAEARIVDVASKMIDEDVRHLAIMDGDEIIGIVSVRDVFPVVTEDLVESW